MTDGKHADDEDRSKPEEHAEKKRATPPAGPHARQDLVNSEATPGTGLFSEDKEDDEVDTGGG